MTTAPLPPRLQNFLSWQASLYSEHAREKREVQPGPFVTVSRQYGCEGVPLAERIVERLNRISAEPVPWVVLAREAIQAVADKRGAAGDFVEALVDSRRGHIRQTVDTLLGRRLTEYQVYEALVQSLLALAEAGRAVLVGRGGAIMCAESPRGTHVRLIAPLAWRAAKVARHRKISAPEAEAVITHEEQARESFVREFTGKSADDPLNYDMIFNNTRLTVDQAADLVVASMRARGHV